MWKNINLEQCLSHIQHGLKVGDQATQETGPAITISRMCGAGGRTVASKLVDYLQPHAPLGRQWTIFDKKLIEKVLDDHLISARLADYLPESGQSMFKDLMTRLRGHRPLASRLVEDTVETVWKLAADGYVILVGRGGNVITAGMKNVFHVRLVGSFERRVERVQEVYEMSRPAAMAYVKAQDAAKRLYLKGYFGRDINDPELYHLIVNTDRIAYEKAASLIAETFLAWRTFSVSLQPA